MTAEGSICWPPVCGPSDTKVPPNHFGTNLAHFTNRNRNRKQFNCNQKSPVKKNPKYKNGNRNHYNNGNGRDNKKKSGNGRSNKNAWKTQPPSKADIDKHIGQTPVYKKKDNAKVFQWFERCDENRKWVLSHNTATHQDDFKQKKRNGNKH